MFILLSGVADALYDGDTRSRIGQMMRRSGVAITITSLTDILAFGAGASSTFKSVMNFCVFTGNDKIICHFMRKSIPRLGSTRPAPLQQLAKVGRTVWDRSTACRDL